MANTTEHADGLPVKAEAYLQVIMTETGRPRAEVLCQALRALLEEVLYNGPTFTVPEGFDREKVAEMLRDPQSASAMVLEPSAVSEAVETFLAEPVRRPRISRAQVRHERPRMEAAAIAHFRKVGFDRSQFNWKDVFKQFPNTPADGTTAARWIDKAVTDYIALQPKPAAPRLDLPN